MTLSKTALACALGGLILAGTASAQRAFSQTIQTAAEFGSYYADAEPSPSDRPTPAEPTAAPAQDACNTCGNQCDCCSDECCNDGYFDWPCCKHEEAWKLFDCDHLKCHKTTIAGFVDQGYTWNPDYPADRFNGPMTFNDRANEYQLNQVWLYAERPVDTKGCGWDFGYRIDALYGTDFRHTLTAGLDAHNNFSPRWNSSRFYGLALPQSYAEIGYNKLKVKLGHFFTPLGYEVVPATGNFFYSHAYTHQYGEPFTHTGGLATYTVNEQLTLNGSINRGWDQWDDINVQQDRPAYIAGFAWNSCDKKTSLAFNFCIGDEPDNTLTVDGTRYIQSLVFQQAITDQWKYVFVSDYGVQQLAVGGVQDAEWYGTTHYLLKTINQCWSYGARFEWFRDDDGFRVVPGTPGNVASSGGFAGNFYDITVGLNWKPNANWTVRPEVRYDWYDGVGQPFDSGTDDDQFTAALDVITTF